MDEILGQDYISQLLDFDFQDLCQNCPYRAVCGYDNKSNCCEGKFNTLTLKAERIA